MAISALAAAQRELAEETGLIASDWSSLASSNLSVCVTDESARLFLARNLTAGRARPAPDERITTRWVTLADALGMIDAGEISDAVSQLAILLASRRLT